MTDPILRNFGLKRHPFTVNIDVEGLYHFAGFQQGLLRLEQAARQRGTALVTAEPGSGKTAMVRSLIKKLATSSYICYEQLVAPGKSPAKAVVEGFLTQMGEPLPFNNASRCWSRLRTALLQLAEKQRTPVLILDDVHHLTVDCWLALKSLMNFELDSRQPILLILLGGPGTLRQLNFQALEEVRDRIASNYVLKGLQDSEVGPYLDRRMAWAGAERPVFPEDVIVELGRSARGNPRRLNRLASTSLLAAAVQNRKLVDHECLEQARSELQFQSVTSEE